MRKLLLCLCALVFLPTAILTSLVCVRVLSQKHTLEFTPTASHQVGTPLEAPPQQGTVQGISTAIAAEDARPEIVAAFLKRYNSPLEPAEHFGKFIVETADKYNVDYRLIPAIMMQESNLCKNIPPDSHNCLGFGIHARGTLMFNSYEESIERATRELKANYIDKGLVTPEQIMRKYTPGSNGSWAASVNQWIAEMEYNDHNKGKTEKSDADLLQYTQK